MEENDTASSRYTRLVTIPLVELTSQRINEEPVPPKVTVEDMINVFNQDISRCPVVVIPALCEFIESLVNKLLQSTVLTYEQAVLLLIPAFNVWLPELFRKQVHVTRTRCFEVVRKIHPQQESKVWEIMSRVFESLGSDPVDQFKLAAFTHPQSYKPLPNARVLAKGFFITWLDQYKPTEMSKSYAQVKDFIHCFDVFDIVKYHQMIPITRFHHLYWRRVPTREERTEAWYEFEYQANPDEVDGAPREFDPLDDCTELVLRQSRLDVVTIPLNMKEMLEDNMVKERMNRDVIQGGGHYTVSDGRLIVDVDGLLPALKHDGIEDDPTKIVAMLRVLFLDYRTNELYKWLALIHPKEYYYWLHRLQGLACYFSSPSMMKRVIDAHKEYLDGSDRTPSYPPQLKVKKLG